MESGIAESTRDLSGQSSLLLPPIENAMTSVKVTTRNSPGNLSQQLAQKNFASLQNNSKIYVKPQKNNSQIKEFRENYSKTEDMRVKLSPNEYSKEKKNDMLNMYFSDKKKLDLNK